MQDHELGAGKTCFIISPIGDALAPMGTPGRLSYEQSLMMWSKVIEPACSIFGLRVVRADKISEPGEIPDQIFAYLRDSEVVIADVSNANPNVMYELGLRHSTSAITLQIGEYDRLPFDIATIRTQQFQRHEAGLVEARDALIDTLRAALTSGPTELRATRAFRRSALPADVDADVQKSSRPDESEEVDEPGIVEILAEGERATEHVAVVLTHATEVVVEIGDLTQAAGAQITAKEGKGGGFAARLTITHQLADALGAPAAALEESATEFVVDVRSIGGLVRHVVARVADGEEDTTDVAEFLSNVLGLVDAAQESAVGVASMLESVRGLRKLSKALGDVSRAIERGLGRYLEGVREMEEWRQLIDELEIDGRQ